MKRFVSVERTKLTSGGAECADGEARRLGTHGFVERKLGRIRLTLLGAVVPLLVLGAVLLVAPATAHAATVTFADTNLEAAVRTNLAIPAPTPVTDIDMLRLTSIDASGPGIADLIRRRAPHTRAS